MIMKREILFSFINENESIHSMFTINTRTGTSNISKYLCVFLLEFV